MSGDISNYFHNTLNHNPLIPTNANNKGYEFNTVKPYAAGG